MLDPAGCGSFLSLSMIDLLLWPRPEVELADCRLGGMIDKQYWISINPRHSFLQPTISAKVFPPPRS